MKRKLKQPQLSSSLINKDKPKVKERKMVNMENLSKEIKPIKFDEYNNADEISETFKEFAKCLELNSSKYQKNNLEISEELNSSKDQKQNSEISEELITCFKLSSGKGKNHNHEPYKFEPQNQQKKFKSFFKSFTQEVTSYEQINTHDMQKKNEISPPKLNWEAEDCNGK